MDAADEVLDAGVGVVGVGVGVAGGSSSAVADVDWRGEDVVSSTGAVAGVDNQADKGTLILWDCHYHSMTLE